MKNKGLIIGGIVLATILIMVAVFMPTNKEDKEESKTENLLGIDYSKKGNEITMDQYGNNKSSSSNGNKRLWNSSF